MNFREWRNQKIEDAISELGEAYEGDIRIAYNEKEFELREKYRNDFEEKSKDDLEEFFKDIRSYIKIR